MYEFICLSTQTGTDLIPFKYKLLIDDLYINQLYCKYVYINIDEDRKMTVLLCLYQDAPV